MQLENDNPVIIEEEGATPDPKEEFTRKIEEIICKRLIRFRLEKKMSRQQLADKIGVSNQQAQKYEKGINRISAGRLYSIAKALGIPIELFYTNIEAELDEDTFFASDIHKELLEIVTNFKNISNPAHKENIFEFVKSLSNKLSDS